MKSYLLPICTFFLLTQAISQNNYQETQLGIKIINEYNENFEFAFGLQSVFRIKKHAGMETGLYYKPRRMTLLANSAPDIYIINISDRSLQLPIWYRFDSKKLNFLCGPVIEYFLGWKNKTNNPNVTIYDYNREPKTRLAISAGITKTIRINNTIIVEPELRANFFTDSEQPDFGINIAFRKRMKKG
jgi:hypothetical protein